MKNDGPGYRDEGTTVHTQGKDAWDRRGNKSDWTLKEEGHAEHFKEVTVARLPIKQYWKNITMKPYLWVRSLSVCRGLT